MASVDPALRATTRMDDLRSAHAPFLEVIAEMPLVELVSSWVDLNRSVALVVDEHGVLIGTVSNQNIEYALERRKFQGLDAEGSAD
jgi:CBS-domain-containing membrane protein